MRVKVMEGRLSRKAIINLLIATLGALLVFVGLLVPTVWVTLTIIPSGILVLVFSSLLLFKPFHSFNPMDKIDSVYRTSFIISDNNSKRGDISVEAVAPDQDTDLGVYVLWGSAGSYISPHEQLDCYDIVVVNGSVRLGCDDGESEIFTELGADDFFHVKSMCKIGLSFNEDSILLIIVKTKIKMDPGITD